MSNWETLKERGNEEYKKKNYNTAINLYTEAIGILLFLYNRIKQPRRSTIR